MVSTALDACDVLKQNDIVAAVMMLDRLTPFDDIASQIANATPTSVDNIVFVEEEIRAGGMGMMLSDAIKRLSLNRNIKHSIIAVSDPFVCCEPNMTYHEMNGLDPDSIAGLIINMKKEQTS